MSCIVPNCHVLCVFIPSVKTLMSARCNSTRVIECTKSVATSTARTPVTARTGLFGTEPPKPVKVFSVATAVVIVEPTVMNCWD